MNLTNKSHCDKLAFINSHYKQLIIFLVFFRFCFAPFGRSLGIKTSRLKKAAPNPILDKAYNGKKIKQKQVLDYDFCQ